MALAKTTKEEIVKLLKEGKLSKRAIHRQTGVSRVTIDKIENSILFPEKRPPTPLKKEWPSKVEFSQCSQCGAKLIRGTPCIHCHLKRDAPLPEKDWLDRLLTPGG